MGGAFLYKNSTPVQTKKSIAKHNVFKALAVEKAQEVPAIEKAEINENVLTKKPILKKKTVLIKDQVKNTQSSVVKKEIKKVEERKNSLALAFSSSVSTSLHRFDDPRKTSSSNFSISPSISLKNGLNIATELSLTKELDGYREESINDSYIAFSKGLYQINKNFSLNGSAVVLLPISETSRKVTFLNTAIKVSPSLGFSYNDLSIGYSLGLTKNFHTSKVNSFGSSNSEYVFSQSLSMGYNFSLFSLSMSGNYSKALTYEKNERDSYSFAQTISFSLPRNIGLSLGHSLGGNIWAINGQDSNIELFNSDVSAVFMALSFIYQ